MKRMKCYFSKTKNVSVYRNLLTLDSFSKPTFLSEHSLKNTLPDLSVIHLKEIGAIVRVKVLFTVNFDYDVR